MRKPTYFNAAIFLTISATSAVFAYCLSQNTLTLLPALFTGISAYYLYYVGKKYYDEGD